MIKVFTHGFALLAGIVLGSMVLLAGCGGDLAGDGFGEFTITIDPGMINGSVNASVKSADKGATVTLTIVPDPGCTLKAVSVSGESGNVPTSVSGINKRTFIMPGEDVYVIAEFSQLYTIAIDSEISNGSVVPSVFSAIQGTEVYLTITPDNFHQISNISVNRQSGTPVSLTFVSDTERRFTMPGEPVMVTAVFTELPKFKITIAGPFANGAVASDLGQAYAGLDVRLTITPAAGFRLRTITVSGLENPSIPLSGSGLTRTFTMPGEAVTVTAVFEEAKAGLMIDNFEPTGANNGTSIWDLNNSGYFSWENPQFHFSSDAKDGPLAGRVICTNWWSRVGRGFSSPIDLSGYSRIIVWMKSDNTDVSFGFRLQSANGWTNWDETYTLGPVTEANVWQQFEFPLDEGINSCNLSAVTEWNFNLSTPCTIYIDSIMAE